MGHSFRTFLDLCLLKSGPQDIAASIALRNMAIFSYWLIGVIVTTISQAFGEAVFLALVQTILLVFFTQIVLWIAKRPERTSQTITALAGAGAIIGLVAIPVLMWLSDGNATDINSFATILWVALFMIWETIVIGHIFRHAVELPFLAGIGIAILYVFVTLTITVRFLRVMSMASGN